MSVVPTVSVVIPTFRLPEGLRVAALSVLAQRDVDPRTLELVIVDNAPEAPSRAVGAELAAQAPFPVVWVHEPRPGVSNARNAGVAAARGEFIAFLDDDEEAAPDWLAHLLAAQKRLDADILFGPVEAHLPLGSPQPEGYFRRFFSRTYNAPEGLTEHFFGTANSLFRVATTLSSPAPFDVGANEFGGEDDALFRKLAREGRRFGWTPHAVVREIVPVARATWRYTLRRAFAHGHGVVCDAAERGHWGAVAGWMLKGAAQAAGMAVVTAALWLIRDQRWGTTLDLAARGVGKVLWFGPFRQRFYGIARVT